MGSEVRVYLNVSHLSSTLIYMVNVILDLLCFSQLNCVIFLKGCYLHLYGDHSYVLWCDIKTDELIELDTGITGLSPLTIPSYNLQWHSRQFSITVYSTIAISQSLKFTTQTLGYLGLLSHTSSPVPNLNGGRYPFWVPELSPCHNHSDS
jgi:hypothetical protein